MCIRYWSFRGPAILEKLCFTVTLCLVMSRWSSCAVLCNNNGMSGRRRFTWTSWQRWMPMSKCSASSGPSASIVRYGACASFFFHHTCCIRHEARDGVRVGCVLGVLGVNAFMFICPFIYPWIMKSLKFFAVGFSNILKSYLWIPTLSVCIGVCRGHFIRRCCVAIATAPSSTRERRCRLIYRLHKMP